MTTTTVKSFRLDDKYISMIKEIEAITQEDFKYFLQDYIESEYFRVSPKFNEKRTRVYVICDVNRYSDFYLSHVEAWQALRSDPTWSTEAFISACYGPDVIVE